MKSDVFDAYRSAMDHLPLRPGLEEYISRNLPAAGRKRRFPVKRVAAAAAAVVLLFAAGVSVLFHFNEIELANAQGKVSAHDTPFSPKAERMAGDLINLTEEELFHTANLAPFLGKVEKIRNIRIDLNGSVSYRAIAAVKVEKAYLANVTPGSTVSILLPCSIGRGEQSTATEIAASLRKGMTGIFMPVAYSDTDYKEENGARIYLRELAPYGLRDGMRYLFLQGADGKMTFDHSAYPSLNADASLEEIEAYAALFWKE